MAIVLIRAETDADYPAIASVVRTAFEGRDAEVQLVENIRAAPGFDPRLSLVAEVDGKVIGHVLFSPCVIDGARGEVAALALAPVSVLPGYESLRVGTRLMRAGLLEAARLGHGVVIVLGHTRYYRRFGFGPARARGIAAPWPVRDHYFQVLELRPGALAGVGGTVRYPPAFGGDVTP